MKKSFLFPCLLTAFWATSLNADIISLSLGIRETGGSGPAFSNAGTSGGIEWVNLDGQSLTLDGTWQLFTFTPSVDALTPFAGTTANGLLDVEWGSTEHIRLRNTDGITSPIHVWIDDVNNTDRSGTSTVDFEPIPVGTEVMFQEPGFSGSTAGNLLAGGTSAVSDLTAHSGAQSYEVAFQFVDNDPTRWLRLTTFNADNFPNPAVHLGEPGGNPTISFWAKGTIEGQSVPDATSTMVLLFVGCGILGLWRSRTANGN